MKSPHLTKKECFLFTRKAISHSENMQGFFFFFQKINSNKNSEGVEQSVGVFILAELPYFSERLCLGQEAGCRPCRPCGLGGSVWADTLWFCHLWEDSRVCCSCLSGWPWSSNEVEAMRTPNSCDTRLPVPSGASAHIRRGGFPVTSRSRHSLLIPLLICLPVSSQLLPLL